jgi:hypothetical protein
MGHIELQHALKIDLQTPLEQLRGGACGRQQTG